MLVLVILTAIAGMSWPALMRPWSRSLVQQAAQELVRELSSARLRAIEESRVYEFRWRPGTGEFEIASPTAEAEAAQALAAAPLADAALAGAAAGLPQEIADRSDATRTGPANGAAEQNGPQLVTEVPPASRVNARLISGVTFVDPASVPLGELPNDPAIDRGAKPPPPAEATDTLSSSTTNDPSDPSQAVLAPQPWSPVVWLFPDGRTSNAHWTLRSVDDYEIDVYLRGLTGTLHVAPARRRAVVTEQSNSPVPAAPAALREVR
jgi:hypothetical protein